MSTSVLKDACDVQMALGAQALLEMRRNAVVVSDNPAAAQADGTLAGNLSEVCGFLGRYMVFANPAQVTAIALWITHTWVFDAFDFTPYLHIGSPVKRCGKSLLLDCLRMLCRAAWPVVSPSVAVLFRKIEVNKPTLLLDELDTIFTGKDDEGKEALRALLNSGFKCGTPIPRCVGPQQKLQEFHVFCPKALAGIGKLPDTIADRSVPIILARRPPNAKTERFRTRDVETVARPIAEALGKWAEASGVRDALRASRPAIPDQLGDRAADICEPLLAIADMAADEWPDRARRHLVDLCGGSEAQDDNVGVRLLAAFRLIFQEQGVDRLSTEASLKALILRENEPWASWWESDMSKGNLRSVASKLARLLKPFGILSGTVRLPDDSTPKGYKLDSFQDAFSRYLP